MKKENKKPIIKNLSVLRIKALQHRRKILLAKLVRMHRSEEDVRIEIINIENDLHAANAPMNDESKKSDSGVKQMNRWVQTKCTQCGGHGGGHFEYLEKETIIQAEQRVAREAARIVNAQADEVQDYMLVAAKELRVAASKIKHQYNINE